MPTCCKRPPANKGLAKNMMREQLRHSERCGAKCTKSASEEVKKARIRLGYE